MTEEEFDSETQDWYNLGLSYVNMNNVKEAIESFIKVIELKPNSIKTWQYLSILFKRSGDISKTLEACKKLSDLGSNKSDGWFGIFHLLLKANDLNMVIVLTEQSLGLKELNKDDWEKLGEFCELNGLNEFAYKAYKSSLELDPLNSNVLMKIGTLYSKLFPEEDMEGCLEDIQTEQEGKKKKKKKDKKKKK